MYLELHDGKEDELKSLYWREYVPGIEIQDGFARTVLLAKADAPGEYQIDIAFNSEQQRLAWVDSKEHVVVWPKVEVLCRSVSCVRFDAVANL